MSGQVGRHSKISIGSVSSGTFSTSLTLIGKIQDANVSGTGAETYDASNMESLAQEFLKDLPNEGEQNLTIIRSSADAGQLALNTAFYDLNPYDFAVELPKIPTQTTTGDKWTGSAFVTKFDVTIPAKGIVMINATLKRTNKWTFAAGS